MVGVAAQSHAAEMVQLHSFGDGLPFVVFPDDSVDDPVGVSGSSFVFAVSVGGLWSLPEPALGFGVYLDQAGDACEFAAVEYVWGVWHVSNVLACDACIKP